MFFYFLIIKLFIFNNVGMIFSDFVNIESNIVFQAVCKNMDNIIGHVKLNLQETEIMAFGPIT